MKNLKSYHFAWLSARPDRTPEWLSAQIADGFHIHHLDLDHSNDDPQNLVLVECIDHFRLHGLKHARMTTERASHLGKKRWEKTTKEERVRTAIGLNEIRWKRERARRKAARLALQITQAGAQHDAG